MNYQQTLKRLINHANMSDTGEFSREQSLVYHLWYSTKQKQEPTIVPLRDDVIQCLQQINEYINGSPPSQTIGRVRPIDEDLVFVVSSLINDCIDFSITWSKEKLFTEDIRWEMYLTTWMISHAWNAVLHGDIDDIEFDLYHALMAKEFLK